MQIGNLKIAEKYPVLLAPMENVTDPTFRYMVKKFGVDMMFTEFISSDGIIRGGKKGLKKLEIFDYERPIGIQIYGHLVEPMVAAAKLAESFSPDVIDINFGCPVKKIVKRGAGAGMLQNIPLMLKITKKVVDAVKIPVTVKTRLGWDENTKNIDVVAEQLQDVGIKALTIHGRTRSQIYEGNADWSLIGKIKNNSRIKIPIIGNGDIKTPEQAKAAFDNYGVDAIMIGRASIGNPWLFKQVKHFLNTGEILPELSVKEKVKIAKEQLQKSLEMKVERAAVVQMRRHFANYFKGLKNFRETKIKLLQADNPNDNFNILDYIAKTWG